MSMSASRSTTIRMSGLASGLDTESIVAGLMSAQRFKATKIENKITKLQWKQDIWKTINSKVYSFYTGSLYNMKMQGNFLTKKVTSSDEGNVTVTANATATEGSHSIQIKELAKAQTVTGAQLAAGVTESTKLSTLDESMVNQSIIITGTSTQSLDITADTTLGDFVKVCKNAGLNASYDATQRRLFISSKSSGLDNKFSMYDTSDTSVTNYDALSKLGLDLIASNLNMSGSLSTMVQPQDAVFVYNGVTMNSSSNTVTVNGITMELKSKTDVDEVININVSKDTDAIYKKIKSFIKEYNDILDIMNTNYDAKSARGYEPLTDDQKEAMSDTEVEKWEQKIKDALLRRDDNLSSIISAFRTNMSNGVTVNGKNYSLASFGITSTNYSEGGKLHINGDQEDPLTSINTDKLRAAIEKDPDTVAAVFNKLAGDLYGQLSKDMASSTIRSTQTLYNDKEMKKQIDDYQDELKTLNKKLDEMENRYYKQFATMEKTLASLNSQSNSLASMLGNNN